MAALVVSTALLTLASLWVPGIIRSVIDEGLGNNDPEALTRAALTILAIGFARAIFAFGRRYLGEWLVNRTGFDLRNALYDKIQRLHFGYHDQAQTGQLMSRCTEDVSAVSRFIGQGAIDLLNVLMLLAGILFFLTRESPLLTAIGLAPLIVMTFVTLRLGRIAEPMFLRIDNALGAVSSAVQEYATGVQVVRAFARESDEAARFDKPHRELYDARVTLVGTWGRYMPTFFILIVASTALVLWFGAVLELTLGEIVAFNAYLLLLGGPVQDLGFVVSSASEAMAGATRIYEVLDAPLAIETRPNAPALPALTGRITFEDVSFSYRGAGAALSEITFEAEPNQVIALIGPTGSGKTSLVNLIPRFYDPSRGRVLADGHDIRSVDLGSLRRQIGLVLQTSLLFSATLRENIAYGRPDATDDEIVAAARAAQADHFINAFPDGYDTVVGERGMTLSGGQRQRIAIARALLTDPRILILDDATSSVDTRTEFLIQKALDTLMQGRTTFVIAQRLSTVRRADLILVLDGGRIVQRGRHAEMVEQPGPYQEIYNLQLRDQEQFQREMLFLDAEEPENPAPAEPVPHPKAERPDPGRAEDKPLKPSSVR